VAFIAEQDLENPHIKYFEQLNPEWNKVRVYPLVTRHVSLLVLGTLSGLYGAHVMDGFLQWCLKGY